MIILKMQLFVLARQWNGKIISMNTNNVQNELFDEVLNNPLKALYTRKTIRLHLTSSDISTIAFS